MSINKNELGKILEIPDYYWDEKYWDLVDSDQLLDFVNQLILVNEKKNEDNYEI